MMDRCESSDDVTVVEHLPKNETTKLTMDRGVNTLNAEIFHHWGCPYAEFFEPREDKMVAVIRELYFSFVCAKGM